MAPDSARADQELIDGGRDLFRVGFQSEVAGVDEADAGVGQAALEGFGTPGRKNGSFLPHTASVPTAPVVNPAVRKPVSTSGEG